MTYRVTGLEPQAFAHLFGASDADLARCGARRVMADADAGFPCRVTLEDAHRGEPLILLHHVSHDVATPYRSAYAIYVREYAARTASCHDMTPPIFAGRPLAFRAFDAEGMLRSARLAMPGEADGVIRTLFEDSGIAYLHAHNAAHGCFAARVERD